MPTRFRVAYQGTRYHGFQRQAGQLVTVQSVLEGVLQELLGPGQVIAASRTDAGVHAAGQVAVWTGANPIPLERFARVINHRLPEDIRIAEPLEVPPGWDPRRAAVAKAYSYRLWVGPGPCPIWWNGFVWVVDEPLNWAILEQAARLFEGPHDFWAFRTEGSSAKTTTRTVWTSRWWREAQGRLWRYRVIANGFLYHMVRRMVGAQVAAARTGELGVIEAALTLAERKKAGPVAPAQGLTLDWVGMKGEPWDVPTLDFGVGSESLG